jgi:hypothetical protein
MAAGVFISEPPFTARFLFRFGIWSNKQCITPVYALYTTRFFRFTLYKYIDMYLFTQGRGDGGSKPVRRLERQWFTGGVENTNMTDCISSLLTLLNTSKDDI